MKNKTPVADGRPSSSRKRINWKGRGPRAARGECSVLGLRTPAAEGGGPCPGLWLTPRTNQNMVLRHGCWGFLPSSPGAYIARLPWMGQCRGDWEGSLGIWVPGSLLSALLCSVSPLPLCRGTTQGPTPSIPVKALARVKANDNKHTDRSSVSLTIRETQVKTTMRSHLTLLRMAFINKSTNNKCWRGCGEKATLLHCWWKCKFVQTLWKSVWRFLRKLKWQLLSTINFLGHTSGENFKFNKAWAPLCSLQHCLQKPRYGSSLNVHWQMDKWIKMWCVYIYIYKVKYYSAIKKNEIMPLAAMWMDLEIVILSEVNQKEKDKYML